MSIAENALLALGKILLGLFTASVFLVINGFYNAGMGVSKLTILSALRPGGRVREEEVLKQTGTVLLTTSVIYIVYAVFTLSAEIHEKYPPLIAFVIIVVVFTEISVNLFGVFSTKKTKRLVLHANKCISLASSLINLVMVQTALVSFPNWRFSWLFNGLSGVTFGTVAACIGLYLILYDKIRGKFPKKQTKRPG